MSTLQRKIILGAMTLLAAAMTLDFVATPSEIQTQGAVHIPDSIASLGADKGGSKTVAFLGPTKAYGTGCQYAEPLCALLTSEPTARPTVWLQRFSYLGEYWLIKAEVSGREIVAPSKQASLLKQARRTKLRTLLLVYGLVCLYFVFPALTKPRITRIQQ